LIISGLWLDPAPALSDFLLEVPPAALLCDLSLEPLALAPWLLFSELEPLALAPWLLCDWPLELAPWLADPPAPALWPLCDCPLELAPWLLWPLELAPWPLDCVSCFALSSAAIVENETAVRPAINK
jgi:hypothetical protein